MPPRTLLSLLSEDRFQHTGVGKYKGLPGAAPTIPEMAHSYIDQIIESYEQDAGDERKIVGEGLGLLEMVGPKLGMAIYASPKKITSLLRKGISKNKADLKNVQEIVDNIPAMNISDAEKLEMMTATGKRAEEIIREKARYNNIIRDFMKTWESINPFKPK
jgi:hypothetical protein